MGMNVAKVDKGVAFDCFWRNKQSFIVKES